MNSRLHLFGIRHHGPGSAALLLEALDRLDPEAVLIEGSPEADTLLPFAALPGMKPPLALLSYVVDQPRVAVFSPFAAFSPEWQAIQWAISRGRQVHFMDWPVAVSLGLMSGDRLPAGEESEAPSEDGPLEVVEVPPEDSADAAAEVHGNFDPLDSLAEAAGYQDGETFWNAVVEQQYGSSSDPVAVFAAVEEALTAARDWQESRQAPPWERVERDSYREAFMRLNLHKALKEHEGQLAVVVGAWHLGGLRKEVSLAADRAKVKDLPRAKTTTLWVPWTNSRLALRSGYGAGVTSPGWYSHLWSLYRQPGGFGVMDFAARWQAKTAMTLRDAGYPASAASALEAARLGISLAALRGLSFPGLSEMREASLSVLCQGNPAPLAVIDEELYVGHDLGSLDPGIPQTPLVSDLEAWQRKTRLQPATEAEEISLDLRSDSGLLKSTLLHRLNLVGIGWGKLVNAEAGRGTFREVWRLQWHPEFAVDLAEALMYGVTIEQAAAGKARAVAAKSSSIRELADLVHATLVADLPEAARFAIERLHAQAVDTSDMDSLMQSVPPLVQVLRYGTARTMPKDELGNLVRALSVEINAGIRSASYRLDEDAAKARASAMKGYNQALVLHATPQLSDEWYRQLRLMVHDDMVAASIAGLGLRCLHDDGRMQAGELPVAFSWHVSGQEPSHTGGFLEAFVGTSAEILLHDTRLLRMIDDWMRVLSDEDFTQVLPLLRRSFAGFDAIARRRLFQAVFEGKGSASSSSEGKGGESLESPAFQNAIPLLLRILGVAN